VACGSQADPPSGRAGSAAGDVGKSGAAGAEQAGGTAGAAAATGHAGSAGAGIAGAGVPAGGEGGEGGETPGGGGDASGEGGGPQGGSSGAGEGGGAGDPAAGSAGEAGESSLSLEELFTAGELTSVTEARSAFGAVALANQGERVYAVESRRDLEPGPFGLPWRSRFRLAAYDADGEAWDFAAEVDDVVSDVTVHPSGDVTFAILRHPPARRSYEIVRLDRDGGLRAAFTLEEPATLPDGDFGPDDPRPLFRMKSPFADATDGGWVRLLADGEGLFIAFLSYVDVPENDPLVNRLATGLAAYRWQSGAYEERWARVVEGAHGADPGVWAYDELRWRDQAIRPFLALDAVTGDVLLGRAWNNTRCRANVATFAEFTQEDCLLRSVPSGENEWLPFAVTRFDAAGARAGTLVIQPDEDAAEQLFFALAAHDGKLAVAGSVVRKNPDGTKRTYPDPSGYVDYDGYIAIHGSDGARLAVHDENLGRGDVFAALRWTAEGIVAAGSAGWDRWQGGMSISRGADPVLAWLAPDGSRARTRVLSLSDGSRHYNLHDIALVDDAVVAHGFSDAPMTHSADNGNDAARTFGALRLRLGAPAQ
jgi:hypothetical protein